GFDFTAASAAGAATATGRRATATSASTAAASSAAERNGGRKRDALRAQIPVHAMDARGCGFIQPPDHDALRIFDRKDDGGRFLERFGAQFLRGGIGKGFATLLCLPLALLAILRLGADGFFQVVSDGRASGRVRRGEVIGP